LKIKLGFSGATSAAETKAAVVAVRYCSAVVFVR
jgi:hypothetical protein